MIRETIYTYVYISVCVSYYIQHRSGCIAYGHIAFLSERTLLSFIEPLKHTQKNILSKYLLIGFFYIGLFYVFCEA